jgi:hypothetical protein
MCANKFTRFLNDKLVGPENKERNCSVFEYLLASLTRKGMIDIAFYKLISFIYNRNLD